MSSKVNEVLGIDDVTFHGNEGLQAAVMGGPELAEPLKYIIGHLIMANRKAMRK